MPFARKESMCFLFKGRLLDMFPNASNRILTSTPSCTLFSRIWKIWCDMESLRKLKYSRCIDFLAQLMALVRSSYFSWPQASNVTVLLLEKLTPLFCSSLTMSVSEVWAYVYTPPKNSDNMMTRFFKTDRAVFLLIISCNYNDRQLRAMHYFCL